MQLLLLWRDQPPRKRLSASPQCTTAHGRAEGRVDWRSDGFQGHGCSRKIKASGWEGFCIEQLAKYAPWLLPVNRFTVLKIENVNISDSKPKDTYPSAPASHSTPRRLKWERQLSKELSTNALDVCRTSLVLAMELSTTNTSKLYSINTLPDCRATGSFINCDFVCSKVINT